MNNDRMAKKLFNNELDKKRKVGRSRFRWLEDVEKDVSAWISRYGDRELERDRNGPTFKGSKGSPRMITQNDDDDNCMEWSHYL